MHGEQRYARFSFTETSSGRQGREVAVVEGQIKSRERVASFGEVFTAEREVNAMLDLVKQETDRVDSRFLEPACGTGNFLVEILRRKLEAAKRRAALPNRARPVALDYERESVIAITSIYGIDLMEDNAKECRERLFRIWDDAYKAVCKNETSEECREAVRFILKRNIVHGNTLSMKATDDKGNDTEDDIVLTEWSMISGDRMQRRDFYFKDMVDDSDESSDDGTAQMGFFEMLSKGSKGLKEYTAPYRRIHHE